MWVCERDGTKVSAGEFCVKCVEYLESRPDASNMSADQKSTEFEYWWGQLKIPFDLMHERLEKLTNRPIYTHELGMRSLDSFLQDCRNW